MSRRLLRAGAAAIVLAAIAVGVPAALATWGRWPIRGLPTAEQLRELPTTLVSDTAVFAILTVAAWSLWALFMMSIVIEAKAELTGRESAAWLVPAAIRRPASVLVAAVLMTVSVLGPSQRSSAAPLTTAMEGPPAVPSPVGDSTRPLMGTSPPVATTPLGDVLPEVEVRRGDNPWDLATTHLGDPMRWRELWELNRGVPQPDGMGWTEPDVIEPGWRLRLPADAQVVAVEAPSTYTVLPGDTLSEIARDHLGAIDRYPEIFEQNVGLPQPDGETLTDPDHIEPGWLLELDGTASTSPEPTPPVATEPPTPRPTIPEPPVIPPTTVPSANLPATTAPAAIPAPILTPTSTEQQDESRPLPVGLIGGGTAAAGLLLLLERRRRAALRRRTRGTQPAPLRADLETAERGLRAGATPGRAAQVDAALRAIASSSPDALSALRMVRVDDQHVRIYLDEDLPAPPGFGSVDGRTWETTDPVDVLDAAGAHLPPPLPTLCPIGSDVTGAEVLIDLEASPVTFVHAPDAVVREVLQAMAVAIVTSLWASHPRVLMVGLPSVEGVGGEPRVTFDEALEIAMSRVRDETLDGMASRLAHAEACEPVIVLSAVAPAGTDVPVLEALSHKPRSAVAVLCPPTSGVPAARAVHVDEDGSISIDARASKVCARRLGDHDLEHVTELLDAADAPFVPSDIEAAEGPLDLRDRHVDESPVTVDSLRAELDVIVNVLGEVEAERLSPAGSERISVSKQRALEAIAYIALRESSVDREDVQAALWPEGTNSAKTFANAIWEARRVLGTDPHDQDLLPDATAGRYAMSDRVGTDYELFCELVATANGLDGAAAAAEVLADALRLVRGEPFTGVGRSYAWVGPHRGMIVAQILDAAEELAEVRLATGDWRGAEWAARQGLRAMPCDERMYRMLMRSAHAAGNIAGVHRAFKELCDVVADPDDGVEPDDTVHPDTIQLMEELTASGRSARVTA